MLNRQGSTGKAQPARLKRQGSTGKAQPARLNRQCSNGLKSLRCREDRQGVLKSIRALAALSECQMPNGNVSTRQPDNQVAIGFKHFAVSLGYGNTHHETAARMPKMSRIARAVQALASAISGLLEPARARSWARGLAITNCRPCSGVEGREPNGRSICG